MRHTVLPLLGFLTSTMLLSQETAKPPLSGETARPAVFVDVLQTGIDEGARWESAGLTNDLIRHFVDAGYLVNLSERFVRSEAAYFKRTATSGSAGDKIAEALNTSANKGSLQWDLLSEINKINQNKHLTGLWGETWPPNRVVLAPPRMEFKNKLVIMLQWRYRVGYGRKGIGGFVGNDGIKVWDLSGRLIATKDGQAPIIRGYGESDFENSYDSEYVTPGSSKLRAILKGVKTVFPIDSKQ